MGDRRYFPVTDPQSSLLRQQCTNDQGHFYQRGYFVNGDIGLCMLLEG